MYFVFIEVVEEIDLGDADETTEIQCEYGTSRLSVLYYEKNKIARIIKND